MFFLIGWIGCGNPTQDIAALNGDATAGAEVYSANCAGCHGDAGEGVSGPALTDVISGQVQAFFSGVSSGHAHIKGGRIRALGVTTATRSSGLPDVPTIAEAGVPGYEVDAWYGLLAPAATPPAIIARLNAEVAKVMAAPDVEERLFQLGADPALGTPQQLQSYVASEIARWTRLVKDMNIQAD